MRLHEIRSIVPAGELGHHRVEQFEVTADQARFENLRASIGSSARPIKAGRYRRLMRDRTVVMSDTPSEVDDMWSLWYAIKPGSTVLINGLGLGLTVQAAFVRGAESVTVIEISKEVIQLVAPTFEREYEDRFVVINADALEWRCGVPGHRWGVVWHDIWDHITSDNLPDMHKLHRKYGRRCDWQGSWCRAQCERQKNGGW